MITNLCCQHNTSGLKHLLLLFFLLNIFFVKAQKFTVSETQLYDYYGYNFRQQINIPVNGLSTIADNNFGIESIVLNIHHKRISDLKITLESPDGASIWLTNRNGKDFGENYIATKFSQYGKNGLISAGRAPFTGNYRPDGQLEFLNNRQNPNGIWKLFIEDLKQGEAGILDSVQLVFGHQPAHVNIVNNCDLEHIGLCKCANGKQVGELLPDLIIVPFFTNNQVQEYAWNDKVYPGQLRLAATIANIGYGPMEIAGTKEWTCGNIKVDTCQTCADGKISRLKVKQRIFSRNKDKLIIKEQDAGTMYFENMPGHNHYHVDDWVAFRLLRKINNKNTIVASGQKVSYCLFTTGIFYKRDTLSEIKGRHYGEDMPNYGLGNYATCNIDKQGISVGGYDTYGMLYEGQFLQLPKGLKNGNYILEIEIDPHHWYKESNKKNNIFRMKIIISKQEADK